MNVINVPYKTKSITALARNQLSFWITEEGRLIKQANNGSQDAWRKLVMKHQDCVYATAYRLLLSYDDALEVSQETFVAAFKSIGSFRGDSSFKTWLTKIAIRMAFRHVKARPKWEELNESLLVSGNDMKRTEIEGAVLSALAKLSINLRSIIILREYQGFSYSEIADSLGIAIGTVESRLHRARTKLRLLLADCLEDGYV